jgi:hypothetical protein
MGWIIERHPAAGRVYSIEVYREAFPLLLGGMSGALLLYLRAKDPNPPSLPSPPKTQGRPAGRPYPEIPGIFYRLPNNQHAASAILLLGSVHSPFLTPNSEFNA